MANLTHEPVLYADLSEMDIVRNSEHRQQWLDLRRNGIGGSEAAAVALGADPWCTSLEVYWDKCGRRPEVAQTRQMEWGHRLEGAIVEWASDQLGRTVTRRKVMYQHPEYPFMLVNLDGEVGSDGIVEAKNVDKNHIDAWEDGPPLHYMLQVNHQLAVTGRRVAFVAALFGGNDPRLFEVERDDELIDLLVQREERFWVDHVLAGVEPEATGFDSDTHLLTHVYDVAAGSEMILPPDAVDFLQDIAALKASIKALKEQEAAAANRVKQILGGHEVGLLPNGKVAVTWKQITSRKFQQSAFQEADPETYEKYRAESTSRTFLPKLTYREED